MPLTKARSVVLDIVDVSKSLRDNMIDAGIRDYVDDQIIATNATITSVEGDLTTLTSTVATISAQYFQKTGGTITGHVNITPSGVGTDIGLKIERILPVLTLNNLDNRFVANSPARISGMKQGVAMWDLDLGDYFPIGLHPGFNTGANLNINSYADSGILQDTPFSIHRDKNNAVYVRRNMIIEASVANTNRAAISLHTLNEGVASSRAIFGRRADKNLWVIELGDIAYGAGANNSANFVIRRSNDGGGHISSPFVINRASGQTYIETLAVGGRVDVGTVSKTSNGFTTLTNDMIIQWGIANSVPADGRAYVNFPISFPTECLSCQATIEGDSHILNTDALTSVKIINNSQIRLTNGYAFSAVSIYWFAIGY